MAKRKSKASASKKISIDKTKTSVKRVEPKEPEWFKVLDELNQIFTRVSEQKEEHPLILRIERMINRFDKRKKIIKEHFKTEHSLDKYIKQQHRSAIIRKRISSVVSAKKWAVNRLVQEQEYSDIESASDTKKYLVLAKNNYVNPEFTLPEIPAALSLCEVKWLVDKVKLLALANNDDEKQKEYVKKLKELVRAAIKDEVEGITLKWLALTGKTLDLYEDTDDDLPDLSRLPWLGEIEPLKSRIPYRPAWSKRLNSLEAERMRQPTEPEKEPPSASESSDSSSTSELESGTTTVESETSHETATTEEEHSSESSRYLDDTCGIDGFALYDQTNLSPLKSPHDRDPHYTFPGDPLGTEDAVYYDYCLILPLPKDDCGPVCEETHIEKRNLTAARMLSGKAKGILAFLDNVELSHVLGFIPANICLTTVDTGSRSSRRSETKAETVTSAIDMLLKRVICYLNPVDCDDSYFVEIIRHLKDDLREMAGVVRTIARNEMLLFDVEHANPRENLEALRAAINAIHDLDIRTRRTTLPTTNSEKPIYRQTLYFKKAEDFKIFNYRENTNFSTLGMNVPNAYEYHGLPYPGDTDEYPASNYNWRIDEEQRKDLRNYVVYLAEKFKPKLDELMEQSTIMLSNVDDYAGSVGYEKFKTDFELLATGIVQNATNALAELLNDISRQLTIPNCTKGEANKRLGLQVIFRQYWYPAGYVQGKLVGYKNLLPNQKDTLKRRTFIKTTQETTTADEYATARQDDYSYSQKETAEVVKDASDKTNFSASTSGDYDFLVASGEYTAEVGGEFASASKTTQSRMVESTRKGSSKYNEKREVKIRNLTEIEDVQEVSSEVANTNAEITANYFYYQLLRNYNVTVEVNDIRPVLLRARNVPTPAEIDDVFVTTYMHILIHCLPRQLSVDAQENAERIGILAKTVIRRKADMDQKESELEVLRKKIPSTDAEKANQERDELLSKERELYEVRQAFIDVEEEYTKSRTRMNRVVTHLRENITYYMQYIWNSSPKVDQDQLLHEETFGDFKLPEITRGLIRQGYYGNEEIFNYTGPSHSLLRLVLDNIVPGVDICSQFIYSIEAEELTTGTTECKLAHTYISSGVDDDGNPTLEVKNAELSDGRPVTSAEYTVDYLRGIIIFALPLKATATAPTICYTTYEDLVKTQLYQYMEHYHPGENAEELKDKICGMAFPRDPANPNSDNLEPVLSNTTVQLAQDALIVETMPGKIPLLEGFQMAHRMLDVQKTCLENVHLAERIHSKPWEHNGEDTYKVTRQEGQQESTSE